MRGILLLLVLALAAPVAGAEGARCVVVNATDAACAVETRGMALGAERADETRWTVTGRACLAEPGELVVSWGIPLADAPLGQASAASTPTGDAACPHLALVEARVPEHLFDPFYECIEIVGASSEAFGVRAVCAFVE